MKHAMPEVRPEAPAATWTLSEAGRRACAPLASRLAGYAPARIVTSVEPKAAETGRLVAAALGVPVATKPGLHEHDLGEAPFLGEAHWQATVEAFFARPDEHGFGRESASEAGDRFVGAVEAVLDGHPAGGTVIVAHGRVISLLVARTNPIDPFALWNELGLPSFVVLAGPDRVVERVAGQVE